MNRAMQIVVVVLFFVAIGVGSFYGGMVYGKGQTQTAVAGAAGAPGQGTAPRAGQADSGQGGMLSGEIQEIGNGFMTITDSSGKQVKILTTDTTLIQKQASVTLADLKQGETVFVSASQGTDGSYTARSVQVGGNLGSIGGNQPGGNLLGGNPAGGVPGAPPSGAPGR